VLSDSDTEEFRRRVEMERRRMMNMRSQKHSFKRIQKLVKTFESDVDAMADDEFDESEAEMKRRMMESLTKKRHVE